MGDGFTETGTFCQQYSITLQSDWSFTPVSNRYHAVYST
jgi:hypothetical protein